MPVGPAGIKAETAQYICGLVASGIVHELHLATGHLIRARNAAWKGALASGVERVLWLDADVFSDAILTERFVDRAEQAFSRDIFVAWYGATCMRRGPEKLLNFARGERNQWLGGLGLVLWHVPRIKIALNAIDHDAVVETPFRWIEPMSEDYRLCDDIDRAGYKVVIDILCPTMHVDVGTWPGELLPNEAENLAAEMSVAI